MKKRILVVDDDPTIVNLITSILERADYEVRPAYTAREALQAAYDFHPDLVILDIRLGEEEMDGWIVCQRLREMSDMLILILSAYGTEADKARGLSLGADDYMIKAFPNADEFLARVKALLRRRRQPATRYTRYADRYLSIDLEKGMATREGCEVALTPMDFRLLSSLVQQAGSVVSHAALTADLWGPTKGEESTHALKVYVRQLRQKLERDASKPQYIVTARGRGYYFKAQKRSRLE